VLRRDTIRYADSECIAFSPDAKNILLFTNQSENNLVKEPTGASLTKWSLDSKQSLFRSAPDDGQCPINIYGSGELLEVDTEDGLNIYDGFNGHLLVQIYSFLSGDWAAVTPDGLFDGTPDGYSLLKWRFNGNTFDLAPVEIFLRDFYHPGLLAEIFSGRRPRPVAALTKQDRRQPCIRMSEDEGVKPGIARVTLRLKEAPSDALHEHGSGVRDVRLLRNGVLAKWWHGEIPLDASGSTTLVTDIPLAGGGNRLTAYAFNRDNVKSADASSYTYNSEQGRAGVAYVVAIGIDRYTADTPGRPINLRFAVADARDFGDAFSRVLKSGKEFKEVRLLTLFDDHAAEGDIRAVIRVLGGMPKVSLSPSQRETLHDVDAIGPDDGLFVFYAGHGAADSSHFYFLPHDADPLVSPSDSASHAISDYELSGLLEPISASRAFLIIDACQSGKLLESDIPVGPINASGLAQLAFDKGMYILAAAQTREAALETSELANGHGYLTYALIDEALKQRRVSDDQQGLSLRSWFEYATR
jgi:hypothetical protein